MSNCKEFYGIEKDYFVKAGGGYTAEEIARQPEVWEELGRLLLAKKDEIAAFHKKMGDIGKMRVIFTGAGSSAFIGDALAPMLSKCTGIKAESIPTTDLVTSPESFLFPDIPTLLVSFARSGNSPESAGAVSYARSVIKDLWEVAITCDEAGKLYEVTAESAKSLILVMPEGANDKGFAMTSSVSCMLLTGFAFFNADQIDALVKDIALLSGHVRDSSRQWTETASKWAEKEFGRIVYLGCGFLKHTAHEASLKMLELTNGRVNSTYESATGFRHGPKTVINDETVTVHMISNHAFTAKYDKDLLNEVCAEKKQNQAIALGGEGDMPADEAIPIPSKGYGMGGDICTGLHALVFCQMVAMFKSLSLGITPDGPSPTGEVNRVVKGVTIYAYQ